MLLRFSVFVIIFCQFGYKLDQQVVVMDKMRLECPACEGQLTMERS